MPRQPRIDFPGLLHHVIVRGIEKRPVFLDDQDREEFLSRFSRLLVETETVCFAWALLDTHFHLLLQPHTIKLAHFMRRLLTGYAVVFNLRHKRAGHLFQNRYKSIVCDGDAYLLELIRYVHLNPLRAGIVKDLEALEAYSWCGHRELLGLNSRKVIAEKQVLSLFSKGLRTARGKYSRFVHDGVATSSATNLSSGGKRVSMMLDPDLEKDDLFDDRVLGGGVFVERVLKMADQAPATPEKTFAAIIARVANYYGIEPPRMTMPGKERSLVRAKAVLCYFAVRLLGMRGVDVATALAYTPAAVSHAAKRGERIVLQEAELQQMLGGNL